MNNLEPKLVLGYLVFLNDKNWERRSHIVESSLKSLSVFRNANLELLVINNGGGDRTRAFIDSNVTVPYRLIDLEQNFMDVAVHFCSFWRAQELGLSYFAYTYDDFIMYDGSWIEDAITFMNQYPVAASMRLPQYVVGSVYFNCDITPKSKNPDAVRHYVGLGEKPLMVSPLQKIGTHEFALANWYSNSRPTMWRVEAFNRFQSQFPLQTHVMQEFEFEMLKYGRALGNYVTAFMNIGMCRTFPVETSERTTSPTLFNDVLVDLVALNVAYKKTQRS